MANSKLSETVCKCSGAKMNCLNISLQFLICHIQSICPIVNPPFIFSLSVNYNQTAIQDSLLREIYSFDQDLNCIKLFYFIYSRFSINNRCSIQSMNIIVRYMINIYYTFIHVVYYSNFVLVYPILKSSISHQRSRFANFYLSKVKSCIQITNCLISFI